MTIANAIVHKVTRTHNGASVNINQKNAPLTLNGLSEESLRELKLNFIKKLGKFHGRFSHDYASFPLANWIHEYRKKKISFVSLSQNAIQHFKLEIEKTEAVIDAFVFFVEEHFEHGGELYIYVSHHNQSLYLDSELEFKEALSLDTKNPVLAAKINLSEFENNDAHLNYLSLHPWRGEKEISDAFSAFVGFSDKADIKEDTEKFIDAIESYSQTLPEDQAIATRENVVNYCIDQDKRGNKVVIDDIAAELDDHDAQNFVTHIRNHTPDLKPELIPDRQQLKQYIRISGRNELLSMSFDSKCLGESIVYDADSDELTITQIPSALKTRLLRHLQKR